MFNRSHIRSIALTLLRVVIGWHFLFEGISKFFTPGWTSADFLSISNWVFSGFFHWIAETPQVLAIADFIVIWTLILIGLALFLGIFERVAALAGMILLGLFWLANPPLTGLDFGIPHEGNYLIVDKNIVEFFALLIICLFPSGKFFGLAAFFKSHVKKPVVEDDLNIALPDNTLVDRRTLLRGLSSLPFLGLFGFALYRQKKWESYEEKNLVDAVTGASAKVLNISGLKDLKGTVPMAKIKDMPFSRIILGGNLLSGWAHSRDPHLCIPAGKSLPSEGKDFCNPAFS